MIHYLEAIDGALEAVLAQTRLSRRQLEAPDGAVPLVEYTHLLEVASRITRDDVLGLHVYMEARIERNGALGYLLRHAPTVGQALDDLVRYVCLEAQGIDLRGGVVGDHYQLCYRVADSRVTERRQDAEVSMAVAARLLRDLAGDDWSLHEVHFEHTRPVGVLELERFFDAPIRFEQSWNRLIFPAAVLDRAGRATNERLYTSLKQHADTLLEESGSALGLTAQIRRQVIESLSYGEPRIDEFAERMAISTRTLQRRLARVETTFAEIVDHARRDLSFGYLSDQQLPVSEIAFLLGYSELSAFHRAFRRWTGSTPTRYRQNSSTSAPPETRRLRSKL